MTDSRPSFYYATGTAYMLDLFGSGYGQIGGGLTIIVPGINGDSVTWDGAPTNDPFPWMLNQKLWDPIKVKFADAALPMTASLAEGVKATLDLIRSRPGKFALGGYSQGAAVMSYVLNELRSGTMQSRYQDLLGMVTFGNPCREVNHLWPGGTWSGSLDVPGSSTGGHGVFPASDRLVNSPDLLWDFANRDEIITSVGDSPAGMDIQLVAGVVIGHGTMRDVMGWLATQFAAGLIEDIQSVIESLDGLKAAIGNGGGGHVLYPTEPPPGDPQHGLTSYQIALNHMEDIGQRWQQGSGQTWSPAPTFTTPYVSGAWTDTPQPSALLNQNGWWSLEGEVAANPSGVGTLVALVHSSTHRTDKTITGSGSLGGTVTRLNQWVERTVDFASFDSSQYRNLYSGLSVWGYSLDSKPIFFGGDGELLWPGNDGLTAQWTGQNTQTVGDVSIGLFEVLVSQIYSVTASFSSSGLIDPGDIKTTEKDGFWANYGPAFGEDQSSVGSLTADIYAPMADHPVSMSGTGVLTGAASIGNLSTAATLSGSGNMSAATYVGQLSTAASLSGTGGITASTSASLLYNAALAGAGAFTSAARIYSVNTAVALAGSGVLTASASINATYPQISLISTGSPAFISGATVTITGTYFIPGGTTITVGGVAATSVSVSSATSLTCVLPSISTSGTKSVVASTWIGGGSGYNISYVAAPTYSGVSPGSGKTGASITVTGTNFIVGATTATINGVSATCSASSTTSATVTVPNLGASNGTYNIVITTVAGTATGTGVFIYYAPPTYSSISVPQGKSGATITVTGSLFYSGMTATVGGTAATTTYVSPTSCNIVIPTLGSEGAKSIVLTTTQGGSVTATNVFTYYNAYAAASTTYTTGSGSYTIPVWANYVDVICMGGGGGGGGSSLSAWGGGGSGGKYGSAILTRGTSITWGTTTLAYSVGGGGAQVGTSVAGKAGTASTAAGVVTGTGGTGGAASNNGGTGTSSGTTTVSGVVYASSVGAAGGGSAQPNAAYGSGGGGGNSSLGPYNGIAGRAGAVYFRAYQ